MSAGGATLATAADLAEAWRPRVNPWVVTMTVMLTTFMEVLDGTIANVALPHIASNLSASVDEATWVLTSYLVSNAIVLPLSGWFSSLFGRKRFYMACVILFTVGSLLCGLAPSLGWLVFFRVLPGGRRRGAPADVAGDPGREFPADASRAWRWRPTAWASSWRRSSARPSAAGSPTTTPGGGSSSSTSPSASCRSSSRAP